MSTIPLSYRAQANSEEETERPRTASISFNSSRYGPHSFYEGCNVLSCQFLYRLTTNHARITTGQSRIVSPTSFSMCFTSYFYFNTSTIIYTISIITVMVGLFLVCCCCNQIACRPRPCRGLDLHFHFNVEWQMIKRWSADGKAMCRKHGQTTARWTIYSTPLYVLHTRS